jgi:transcriptional regulator of acetoin/glycerol metabolism
LRELERHGRAAESVDARLLEALCLYPWPQNIRELVQLAHRLATLHVGDPRLLLKHLEDRFCQGLVGQTERRFMTLDQSEAAPRRDDVDCESLVKQLRIFEGNVARAATAAGLSRQRAYRLIERRLIDPGQFRNRAVPTDDDERSNDATSGT